MPTQFESSTTDQIARGYIISIFQTVIVAKTASVLEGVHVVTDELLPDIGGTGNSSAISKDFGDLRSHSSSGSGEGGLDEAMLEKFS